MISRRTWLRTLVGTAVAARTKRVIAAEPALENTRIRLVRIPGICIAPQYVAEDLLRLEGFLNISYVETQAGVQALQAVGSGQADFSVVFAGPVILGIDTGEPIVVLAGVHVGCFELFATDRVHTIRDLKGKTVAVQSLQSSQHVFLSSMAAHVGLDPRTDIRWATYPSAESIQHLKTGKIDAFLAFPPEPRSSERRRSGTSS
jgi:NitT/TauT family transport system substrate-binding protein